MSRLVRVLKRAFSFRDPDNQYSWKDAIVDAAIVAGQDFFSTLASMTVTQIVHDPVQALIAASISAGLGFFVTLSIKRSYVSRR